MLSDIENLPEFYADCQKQFAQRLDIARKVFTPDELIKYFKSHHIMVKTRADGTLKFKYNPICKFEQPSQHACRGTTMLSNGTLVPALNKFFNHGQFETQYGFPYQKLWDTYSKTNCNFSVHAAYKIDGTNIQVTYNTAVERFEITTLGSLNAVIMQGNMTDSPTFEQMFINLAKKAAADANADQDLFTVMKSNSRYSLVFEMCSKYNKIVTDYDKEFIQLLAIIDLDTGLPVVDDALVNELKQVGIDQVHTRLVTSEDEVQEFMQYIVEHPEVYGSNPEGLVLNLHYPETNTYIPFVKYKRQEYLQQTGAVIMNPGNFQDLCRIEHLVLNNTDDDLQLEVQQSHAKKFRTYLADKCAEMQSYMDQLANCTNSKEYALKVQELTAELPNKDHPMNQFTKPFLYEIKQLILNQEDADSWELISAWLLKETNGITRLSKLQAGGNIDQQWFNRPADQSANKAPVVKPPTFKSQLISKVVVFDLDGTVWKATSKPVYYKGDWWTDPESLATVEVCERVCNLARAYYQHNFKVIFLTGRKQSLYAQVLKHLRDIFPFEELNLLCTPDKEQTSVFKKLVISMLRSTFERVLVFDDDVQIHEAIQDTIGCRLTQMLVNISNSVNIIEFNPNKKGIFITLVQPPASGKTSILTQLMETYTSEGQDCVRLSVDMFKQQKRQELLDNNLSQDEIKGLLRNHDVCQQIFNEFIRQCRHYYHKNYMVFIDCCNDNYDTIKSLNKIGTVKSYSFVPITRDNRGKSVVSPAYLAWVYHKHVQRRNTGNESTLCLEDDVKSLSIIMSKTAGCGMQVTNAQRKIHMLDEYWDRAVDRALESQELLKNLNKMFNDAKSNKLGKIEPEFFTKLSVLAEQVVMPDVEHMTTMLYERVNQDANVGSVECISSYYLAAPVTIDQVVKPKHTVIEHPHYTLVPPMLSFSAMNAHADKIGQPIKIKLLGHYVDSEIEFVVARDEHMMVEHGHVTVSKKAEVQAVLSLDKVRAGVEHQPFDEQIEVESVVLIY